MISFQVSRRFVQYRWHGTQGEVSPPNAALTAEDKSISRRPFTAARYYISLTVTRRVLSSPPALHRTAGGHVYPGRGGRGVPPCSRTVPAASTARPVRQLRHPFGHVSNSTVPRGSDMGWGLDPVCVCVGGGGITEEGRRSPPPTADLAVTSAQSHICRRPISPLPPVAVNAPFVEGKGWRLCPCCQSFTQTVRGWAVDTALSKAVDTAQVMPVAAHNIAIR